MDWNEVADGLAAAASTTGINALEYVPDSLPHKAFYVGEIDIDTNITFGSRSGTRRGTDAGTVTSRVLIAKSDDKYALKKLREYMGGSGVKSLVQAIQADRTLGGACDDSIVKSVRGNRLFDVGGSKYYGVEIDTYVVGSA
jgi:hypothetical protein